VKERFGATNPRGMMIRQPIGAHIGCTSTTLQRPLNNLARAVVGGVASGMVGALPAVYPPFDEPLGLGHGLEAIQLQVDATRILIYEAGVANVNDPWAGSYFMESLTDETEAAAQAELEKIDGMGGVVAAIESGYMQRAVAKSAYERQKRIEGQEELMVGVNCFTGEKEIEVSVTRVEDELYDPGQMATAEERQCAKLVELRRERDDKAVSRALAALEKNAADEDANLMPDLIECVEAEATIQEICDVLRGVFGEAEPVKL
jgi:methylmalonyl-CoA mutase N-terminal domain/subunit